MTLCEQMLKRQFMDTAVTVTLTEDNGWTVVFENLTLTEATELAEALPWWWRHCPQCCEGSRGAILWTMATRPGTCRGGAFACWHLAWPSCLEQAG